MGSGNFYAKNFSVDFKLKTKILNLPYYIHVWVGNVKRNTVNYTQKWKNKSWPFSPDRIVITTDTSWEVLSK